MGSYDKDKVPMLSVTHPQSVDENADSRFQAYISGNRSASFSIPMNFVHSYETESNPVGFTGPLRSQRRAPELQMSGPLYINRKAVIPSRENQSVPGQQKVEIKAENFSSSKGMDQNEWTDDNYGRNEHLLKSGQLGMCNDPYCTTCPSYYHSKAAQHKNSRASSIFDPKLHSVLYGDAKGWARRFVFFLNQCVHGVINPHNGVVGRWNQFFVFACLLAIFIDPLFFFLLSVQQVNKCMVIDWTASKTLVVFRSLTDFVYLLNMLLQFRLAYVAPESRVAGTGVLVDHPKEIAKNYLKGYFLIDLFIALPLPQIIVLAVLPNILGSSGANYAKNLLRAAVLVQYIPRLYRFLPLLVGQSPNHFIFETAWANFVINLLAYMLSAHVVGSCWYLLGLQRINQCLRDACNKSAIKDCMSFIDCGHGVGETDSDQLRNIWKNNTNAQACFTSDFPYGIYVQAVNLTSMHGITRYEYSLFWGFQVIGK
uniref:Cyclic nucleotide-gated ion channel n=1 Tax=Rhizophora mucronata TaxID=61149 RepID=A0A2P2JKE0_RHIMU